MASRHAVVAFPGASHHASALCDRLDANALELTVRDFPDGETYLRVNGDVAGQHAFVLACLAQPNTRLVPALLAAETLRDLGARSVTLVAPYLPYMRQDRRFQPGEAISARYIARTLSSAFDAVVTVDPHLHRLGDLTDIFSVPTRCVAAASAIARWTRANVANPIMVGPDEESGQWVRAVADALGVPALVLTKERHGDHEVDVTGGSREALEGHTPVLVDDIISSGMTLVQAADRLRELGAPVQHCVGVHGLFAGPALDRLAQAGIRHVVSSDTVVHPTNAVAVSADIADGCASVLEELNA